MLRLPLFRTIFVAMLAMAAALPSMSGSAAIPCQDLPVIEPDPNMPVPMIYIELPVTVEAAFSRGQAVDREGSTEPEEGLGHVLGAAENQFRCLNYGNDLAFAGNSTPQQRVNMWAVPAIDAEETYIDVDSVFMEQFGTPIQLEDGRFLIDFGIIVNQSQYLTGEMVFSEEEDGLYLDSTFITDSMELNNPPITIELSPRFTREVKIVNVTNGDWIVFANQEEESSADIVIEDAEGSVIFEGDAMGHMLVGGESRNAFVVHDMEPGEYKLTITFSEDGVTYNQTLVVSDGDTATPAASPESTPVS